MSILSNSPDAVTSDDAADTLPVAQIAAASSGFTNVKMPRRGAPNVAELSARLFAAYSVEGGTIRLAGCTLEPRAILRVVAKAESEAVFLTDAGEPLDAATVVQLGLNDLMALDKPPRLARDEVERLMELGRQASMGPANIELVWCRYAAGKLRFTIGEQFVELPFADWAVRLMPPAFVCPHSGRSTFKLAATDDGRIVAAEEIASCEVSGRRMLRGELVTCADSKMLASVDLTEVCPVTQQRVLRERLVRCPTCGTRVSPQAVINGRCTLCSASVAIELNDSRMVAILSRHPGLHRWRQWKIAVTPETTVLEAGGLWRRLLLVLNRESLAPIRVARRNRWQRDWNDAPPDESREILQ